MNECFIPTSLEMFPSSFLCGDPMEVVLKCVFDLKECISYVPPIKIHLTPELKRILEILESIHSALTQMSSVDLKLDLPIADIHDFLSVLREAGELVRQCHWQGRVVETERMKKLKDSIYNFYCVCLKNQLLRMSGQLSENKAHHKNFHGMVVGPRHPVEELKLLLEGDGWPLVITGPPGYGKTTLAQDLCQDPAIKDKYGDNIYFQNVPEKPDVAALVGKFLEDIDLRKSDKIPSGILKTTDLQSFIKKIGSSHMLLILDDVWSDCEFLIDEFNFQIPGYKLLVTSRYRFPRFDGYELTRLVKNEGQPLYFQSQNGHLDPNNHHAHMDNLLPSEQPLFMWKRRPKKSSTENKSIYVENLEGLPSLSAPATFERDEGDVSDVSSSNYLESQFMVGDTSSNIGS